MHVIQLPGHLSTPRHASSPHPRAEYIHPQSAADDLDTRSSELQHKYRCIRPGRNATAPSGHGIYTHHLLSRTYTIRTTSYSATRRRTNKHLDISYIQLRKIRPSQAEDQRNGSSPTRILNGHADRGSRNEFDGDKVMLPLALLRMFLKLRLAFLTKRAVPRSRAAHNTPAAGLVVAWFRLCLEN